MNMKSILAVCLVVVGLIAVNGLPVKNEVVEVGDELVQYIVNKAKMSSDDHGPVTDEDVLRLAQESVAEMRADGHSSVISAELQEESEFFSGRSSTAKKTNEEMSAGCARVSAMAASPCSDWKPLAGADGMSCAGTKDGYTRGSIVINKPIDAVFAAIQNKGSWAGKFDKYLKSVKELGTQPEEAGTVFELKWNRFVWGKAVIQEKWCETSGDARTAFATSVGDSKADNSMFWRYVGLDVDVKTAGVYLKAVGGEQTELTYITNAAVAKFSAGWSNSAAHHNAIAIPTAIAGAV